MLGFKGLSSLRSRLHFGVSVFVSFVFHTRKETFNIDSGDGSEKVTL